MIWLLVYQTFHYEQRNDSSTLTFARFELYSLVLKLESHETFTDHNVKTIFQIISSAFLRRLHRLDEHEFHYLFTAENYKKNPLTQQRLSSYTIQLNVLLYTLLYDFKFPWAVTEKNLLWREIQHETGNTTVVNSLSLITVIYSHHHIYKNFACVKIQLNF